MKLWQLYSVALLVCNAELPKYSAVSVTNFLVHPDWLWGPMNLLSNGTLSSMVKQPEGKADHSVSTKHQKLMCAGLPPLLLHAFMARCSVKSTGTTLPSPLPYLYFFHITFNTSAVCQKKCSVLPCDHQKAKIWLFHILYAIFQLLQNQYTQMQAIKHA